MDPVRLGLVALILVLVAGAALAYRRSRTLDERRGVYGLPPLPLELVSGASGTWVIFTTPYCVSCEAVERDLRRVYPAEAVVKIDATERPELAERYGIRRAPTVLRSDPAGRVLARIVGPEGVRRHLAPA
jgi:thiol-disulfide isomerase/thioredoxin